MQFVRNFVAAAALLGCATGAMAAKPGPYVEALGGMSAISIDCQTGQTCDDSDVGFRVGGGYQIDSMFGAEGGYMNLGKFTVKEAFGSHKLKSHGPYAAATLRMELMPKFDFVGKLGAFYAMSKTTCTGSGCDYSSVKGNKLKPVVGLGLQYEVMKGLSVGGSVDITEIDDSQDSSGATLIGAAVRYAF